MGSYKFKEGDLLICKLSAYGMDNDCDLYAIVKKADPKTDFLLLDLYMKQGRHHLESDYADPDNPERPYRPMTRAEIEAFKTGLHENINSSINELDRLHAAFRHVYNLQQEIEKRDKKERDKKEI